MCQTTLGCSKPNCDNHMCDNCLALGLNMPFSSYLKSMTRWDWIKDKWMCLKCSIAKNQPEIFTNLMAKAGHHLSIEMDGFKGMIDNNFIIPSTIQVFLYCY